LALAKINSKAGAEVRLSRLDEFNFTQRRESPSKQPSKTGASQRPACRAGRRVLYFPFTHNRSPITHLASGGMHRLHRFACKCGHLKIKLSTAFFDDLTGQIRATQSALKMPHFPGK
jgi:hypothetical protein